MEKPMTPTTKITLAVLALVMKTLAFFAMVLCAGILVVRADKDARVRAQYVETLYDAYPDSTEQFSVEGFGNRTLVVHETLAGPGDLDEHLDYLAHNKEVSQILKAHGFKYVTAHGIKMEIE